MDLKRIAVTGAAGQIAYSLLFRIANGELFGPNQPIALHLLEAQVALPALQGVVMELQDCAFPLLHEIQLGSDPDILFADIDLALLIGAKPRSVNQERSDLLKENGHIFAEQGMALNRVAKRSVRVLVVGNPCNTNCLIAMKQAPDIPKEQFHALTRLDQSRAQYFLSAKAGVPISEVSPVVIWGNHSSTQVPDFVNTRIGNTPLGQVIKDRSWLEKDFFECVQKRGAQILSARGKSSAASAAHNILRAAKEFYQPTPPGQWYSSARISDGNPYGIREGLIFSFPCRTLSSGQVEIVPGLTIDPFIQKKILLTENELLEEKILCEEG